MSEDNKDNYNIGIFDPEGKNLNPLNGEPYSDEYRNLAKFWSNLPTYEKRKNIVQSIEKNDVIRYVFDDSSITHRGGNSITINN